MPTNTIFLRNITAAATLLLLGACANSQPAAMASNPPPAPAGQDATWYHVSFDTASHTLSPAGEQTVADVTAFLQGNPGKIVTIIGKTDTVGTKDYNMHLSHERADAVRDALVYHSNIAADRVETRWSGENRLHVKTGSDVADASNRVVDIAVH